MKFGFLAGILALTIASSARAVVITDVEFAGPGPIYIISDNVPGYGADTFYDDALVLTALDGTKYYVNCDDLVHNITIGSGQHIDYTVGKVDSNFRGGVYTVAQIGEMAYLDKVLNQIIIKGGPNEAVDLAAEQAASWIVSNPDVTFSVDPVIQSRTDYYIKSAEGKTGTIAQFTDLGNGAQGQTLGAVPEISTWVMILVGFGGVGVALRKRRATLI
jgi:hypothetical protein